MAGHRSEGVWMPPRNSREHDRYLSRHESARSEEGVFTFGAAPTAMRRLTEDATSGLAVPHLVHNLSAPNGTDAVTCELDGDSSAVMIGVIMGVIGSIMINIGQNFQATGLTTTPQAQDNPCSSRTWVIGLTIFIAGALLNFGAFTFASASVLVPIEAIQFVVNVIFNKYVNKKPISCRMVIGVCLTCLGTVSCVVFGPSDARCFTVDDLAAFWTRPLWWIYLVLTTGVAIVAYMTHEAYARAVKSGANPRHKQYIMPVTFALSSALFGAAQMIVHSKAIAELLELQFALIQPFPLLHWFFWLELTILGVTGCYWMFRMNKSLALYDPLFISTRGPHSLIPNGHAVVSMPNASFPRREPSHPPTRPPPLAQSHSYSHPTFYLASSLVASSSKNLQARVSPTAATHHSPPPVHTTHVCPLHGPRVTCAVLRLRGGAGMHNGPAGSGGWPLFIGGMLMILTGLALIAPPPTSDPEPPSPTTRLSSGQRVSRRDDDSTHNGAPAGVEEEAHELGNDRPMGVPSPVHRRSVSKSGLVTSALSVVTGDSKRSDDLEGTSLVSYQGTSTRSSAAVGTHEVVLALEEEAGADTLPVAEDPAHLRPPSVSTARPSSASSAAHRFAPQTPSFDNSNTPCHTPLQSPASPLSSPATMPTAGLAAPPAERFSVGSSGGDSEVGVSIDALGEVAVPSPAPRAASMG